MKNACTTFLFCALALIGCGIESQTYLQATLFARGAKPRDVAIAGATLRLTRAEVAFGPLYLCATESAESELCETARLEFLSTETLDALSPSQQRLGLLTGTSGMVRSGFFDYGITWGLTQQAPRASEGSVDGHSARLEGQLVLEGGLPLTFRAEIDVEPLSPGDAAVNGLRGASPNASPRNLAVVFDPNAWLARIKLERVLELSVDDKGTVLFTPGSQPYEAILQGMTANAPPKLVWND